MMMRSPYMRHYATEYNSAADVQRMAEQLKRQALVWQGRYEQSQAVVEELQHELHRARRAQATENGTTRQQVEMLQAEVEQLRSEAQLYGQPANHQPAVEQQRRRAQLR